MGKGKILIHREIDILRWWAGEGKILIHREIDILRWWAGGGEDFNS